MTEKSGKLRKDLKDLILKSVSSLRNAITELKSCIDSNNEQNSVLSAKVKELEEMQRQETSRRRTAEQVAPSTALSPKHHAARSDITATPGGERRNLYSEVVGSAAHKVEKRYKLMVSSKIKESAEAMKTTLKAKIDPITIKVGIKTFKSLKDGRVLIETGSKDEIEVLSQTINSHCSQTLEAKVSKLRNPSLIFYNIPDDINKGNAEEIIITQNPELALKEGDIRPKFIYRNKNKNLNMVVEVTSEARKKLLEQRIKMGWLICKTEDYIVPIRCFKCSRFNHKHENCEGEETCPLCTGKHKLKDCTATSADFKCTNCIAFNNYTKGDKICENHSSLDKKCPSLLAVIKKYKENTDY